MAIYSSPLYSTELYGPASGTDVPVDLKFYRTNVDDVYVFHWGFDESFISPVVPTLDFELQIDTVNTFDSPNLKSFTTSNVINFQDGDARKGFAVPVASRIDGQEQTFFARVRSVLGPSNSDWSLPLEFTILEKFRQESAENILSNLPDRHVYNKEDLKKSVENRNTNLYKVSDMYGAEFDKSFSELELLRTNLTIDLCRDENLFDNFGIFFSYRKPQQQEFVEYRECLRELILGALVGGTIDAVERVIRCFTGVSPNILLIRNRNDFFLSTIGPETPPESPNGSITTFSTSFDYKDGSLVVLQNGSILTPGVDFTENHAIPGFDMTVAPSSGDVLQVFFDLLESTDPDPVIFDLSDKTSLTGTLTFTKGSTTVTGSGTLFTTELQEGRLITDASGNVFGRVLQISSDTSLTLDQGWIGNTGSGSGSVIDFNGTVHLTGDVTFTNGSTAVTGSGTLFTIELKPGDTITDNDGTEFSVVDSVTDNENLVLKNNWTGSTGSNTNARKLIYSEPILWDSGSLAHGVTIKVLNPGEFALNESLIKSLVEQVLPAHIKFFVEF